MEISILGEFYSVLKLKFWASTYFIQCLQLFVGKLSRTFLNHYAADCLFQALS